MPEEIRFPYVINQANRIEGTLHIPAFFRGNAAGFVRSVAAEPVVWLGAAVEPARMLSAGGTAPLRGHHRAGFRARAAKQCEMPDVSGCRAGNNTGLRLYSGGCHSGPGFTRASGAARFERSSLPLFLKRSRSWQAGASCLVFRCLVRKRGRSETCPTGRVQGGSFEELYFIIYVYCGVRVGAGDH